MLIQTNQAIVGLLHSMLRQDEVLVLWICVFWIFSCSLSFVLGLSEQIFFVLQLSFQIALQFIDVGVLKFQNS